MRPLASAAGATAILRRHGSDEPRGLEARAYGFYVALNTYAKSPYPCEEVYKTALAGAPPRRQSRISSSSSNDGKNLGVTCLYAR